MIPKLGSVQKEGGAGSGIWAHAQTSWNPGSAALLALRQQHYKICPIWSPSLLPSSLPHSTGLMKGYVWGGVEVVVSCALFFMVKYKVFFKITLAMKHRCNRKCHLCSWKHLCRWNLLKLWNLWSVTWVVQDIENTGRRKFANYGGGRLDTELVVHACNGGSYWLSLHGLGLSI